MAFRFSLETVLRLRRSLEEHERIQLQTLLVHRAQLQTAMNATDACRVALGDKLKASLQQQQLPGGEIRFALRRVTSCDAESARLESALASLEQQVERQRARLLSRRIERKVLEQLREQQLLVHDADMQRRSQAQLEELFLLRRQQKSN